MRTLLKISVFPLAVAARLLGDTPEPVLQTPPFFVEGKKDDIQIGQVTDIAFVGTASDTSPAALAGQVPNFFVAESGAHSFNDTFSLRGLTNTPIFGEPAVTFYLDDVPLGGGFTTPDSFLGLSQATVYRGPGQIAGFGRSGSAGVVELSTATPSAGWHSEANLRAGNYAARSASVETSASNNQIDAAVAAGYAARDGYIHNDALGQDVDRRESETALARFGAACFPGLKLSLVLQGERARDGEQPLVPLGGPLFTIDRRTPGWTDFSNFNAGITARLIQSWGDLTATSSLNDWHLGPYRSVLAFGPAELVNDSDLRRMSYNEEINCTWNADGDLHGRCGLFFAKESTQGTFTRSFLPYVIEGSSFSLYTQRLAAHTEVAYKMAADLSLNASLRAEGAEKSMDRIELVPAADAYTLRNRSAALLPQTGLTWTPRPTTEISASLGGGYKPGGFSAFTSNRALSAYGPERTVSAELGLALHDQDRSLQWNSRVFVYRISGYQIERSFATGSTSDDYLVVNAPRARSAGFETELKWRIAGPWSISSAAGLTDTILQSFTDPYTHESFDGKRAPYVPRDNFSLKAEYQNPLGWFARATWTVYGKTYYTESENPVYAQRAYSLIGGQAGYAARRWRALVYSENLFDQGYYTSMAAGTNHGTPGAPRTFGGEVDFAF